MLSTTIQAYKSVSLPSELGRCRRLIGGIALLSRERERDENATRGSLGREHHHRYPNLYNHIYIDLNDNMGKPICTYGPTSTALGSQTQPTRIASVGAEGICRRGGCGRLGSILCGTRLLAGAIQCPLFRRVKSFRLPGGSHHSKACIGVHASTYHHHIPPSTKKKGRGYRLGRYS